MIECTKFKKNSMWPKCAKTFCTILILQDNLVRHACSFLQTKLQKISDRNLQMEDGKHCIPFSQLHFVWFSPPFFPFLGCSCKSRITKGSWVHSFKECVWKYLNHGMFNFVFRELNMKVDSQWISLIKTTTLGISPLFIYFLLMVDILFNTDTYNPIYLSKVRYRFSINIKYWCGALPLIFSWYPETFKIGDCRGNTEPQFKKRKQWEHSTKS